MANEAGRGQWNNPGYVAFWKGMEASVPALAEPPSERSSRTPANTFSMSAAAAVATMLLIAQSVEPGGLATGFDIAAARPRERTCEGIRHSERVFRPRRCADRRRPRRAIRRSHSTPPGRDVLWRPHRGVCEHPAPDQAGRAARLPLLPGHRRDSGTPVEALIATHRRGHPRPTCRRAPSHSARRSAPRRSSKQLASAA